MAVERLLRGNARFVAGEFLADPDYYGALAEEQNPDVLWIGCADSRVSVDTITQTRPGTIFVHRNVANVVAFNDNNFGAVLAFALEHLRIRDIVVCGHYFCGGLHAMATGTDNPVIHDWLNVAADVLDRVRSLPGYEAMDQTRRMEVLTEHHLLHQIEHLERFALVRQVRRTEPSLQIHGLVYDIRSGRLSRVAADSPAEGR